MKTFLTFTILLTALIVIFFETACQIPRNFTGAQIDPLPALMIVTALRAPILSITALAIMGSLWQSSLSSDPLGICMLPLFMLGMLVRLNSKSIAHHHIGSQFALGAIAGALVPTLSLCLLLLSGHQPMIELYSLWQLAVGIIGNGLFALGFFPWLQWLNHTMEEQPFDAPYNAVTKIVRSPKFYE
jgi:hypothetical protein